MVTDSDLSSYAAKVTDLKQREQVLRYDHAALNSMTSLEGRANVVFDELRSADLKSTWEKKGDLDSFAGMEFYGAHANGLWKQTPTGLWELIRKMPKGALLHCHFDGTVDTRFLLEHAKKTPNMAMKSDRSLSSSKALWKATVEFLVLPEAETRSTASIYDEAYVPGTWVAFKTARETFPHPHPYVSVQYPSPASLPPHLFPASPSTTGDDKGLAFDAYVHTLMTLTPHSSVAAITNSKQAWTKFQSTFGVIAGLLGYEPTLKAYTKELLLSHTRDQISYTEARINFLTEFMVRSNGQADLNHEEWVKVFIEAVQEVKQELSSKGQVVDAKIIYTTVRFIDNEKLRWHLEDCISLKKKFPEWIVGFDLVGHEDPLLPLKYYVPELLRFKRRCAEEGVEIPFVFHAGETLDDATDADNNLYDAIVLDTKRIGHGVSLARHPVLTDIVKERDICVEICPISNQILGYTASICSHPSLLALLHRNVPVALSSDDPSIFENFGLSYDFYQLAVSAKGTSLMGLKTLARRSIKYTLLPEDAKSVLELDFDKQWQEFLQWLSTKYSR